MIPSSSEFYLCQALLISAVALAVIACLLMGIADHYKAQNLDCNCYYCLSETERFLRLYRRYRAAAILAIITIILLTLTMLFLHG